MLDGGAWPRTLRTLTLTYNKVGLRGAMTFATSWAAAQTREAEAVVQKAHRRGRSSSVDEAIAVLSLRGIEVESAASVRIESPRPEVELSEDWDRVDLSHNHVLTSAGRCKEGCGGSDESGGDDEDDMGARSARSARNARNARSGGSAVDRARQRRRRRDQGKGRDTGGGWDGGGRRVLATVNEGPKECASCLASEMLCRPFVGRAVRKSILLLDFNGALVGGGAMLMLLLMLLLLLLLLLHG